MRNYIFFVFVLFFSFAVSAQTLYTTKRDSVPAQSDFFILQASPYRGILQWQQSFDGKSWNDLVGQNQPQLTIPVSTEAFYRAKLTDACFETYSDSVVVLMHKVQNKTVDPNVVSDAILLHTDGSKFIYQNVDNNLFENGTLLVTTDSASNIRIVTSTIQKDDSLIVQTAQGNMSNVFINKSFKLTTALANTPDSIISLNKVQQSRSLTNDANFIHPISVQNNNTYAPVAKCSSRSIQSTNRPMLSFGVDLSGQELYNNNGAQLQITEGYFDFNCDFICEFEFEQPHFDFANLKLNAGRLKHFSFYTDPDATSTDAKLVLLAKAGGKEDFENVIMLKEHVINKSFKFMAGEVPVWMDVTMDLMAKVSGHFSSELSISGGASAFAQASFGASYENGMWTPIGKYTKTFTLYGPDILGKANEELKVEVYPHICVKFYKMVGPWLDIAPYVSQEMNVSISGNSNFEICGGTDARLGIELTAFDNEIADFSHVFNLKNECLYQTPYKLKLLGGNNQTGEPGVALTDAIVLQALDSKNNTIDNCFVSLKSFSRDSAFIVLNTNKSGIVEHNWILENVEGEQKIEAYLKNGNDEIISTANTIVTAYCKSNTPTVSTTAVSNINGTVAICGGDVTKDGGTAVTARGVCWNTTGNPTISDNKTIDGIGEGVYTSYLTGLAAGRIYYYRAYATNKNGTNYGYTQSYKTSQSANISPIYINSMDIVDYGFLHNRILHYKFSNNIKYNLDVSVIDQEYYDYGIAVKLANSKSFSYYSLKTEGAPLTYTYEKNIGANNTSSFKFTIVRLKFKFTHISSVMPILRAFSYFS